jgi:hypothetical protein
MAVGYGNYEPPHSWVNAVLSDQLTEENNAYRDG